MSAAFRRFPSSSPFVAISVIAAMASAADSVSLVETCSAMARRNSRTRAANAGIVSRRHTVFRWRPTIRPASVCVIPEAKWSANSSFSGSNCTILTKMN